MSNPVLSLKGVTKIIKKRTLVNNLSFDVQRGQVYGFLGPNGAGKTMTLRMIVGLIKPTKGTIEICGHNIQTDFVKALSEVGCIIENPEFYNYLTGYENLCHFMNMEKVVHPHHLEAIIDKVGMRHKIHDKVSTYSLGMKQRLGIAQALMKNPTLLILDEPTNGLDPAGIVEFRNLVHQLALEDQMTVLISSHLLSELQMICDEVTIILHGKSILTASMAELLANQSVTWHLSSAEKGWEILKNLWGIEATVVGENELLATLTTENLESLNRSLIENGCDLYSVCPQSQTLETLFMTLTGGETIG